MPGSVRLLSYSDLEEMLIDLEAALDEHFLKVVVAERIAQIPSKRLDDQPSLEMPSFEVILRLALQPFSNGN